jgi:hypothetical protein
MPENMTSIRCTFQILGGEKNRANMIIFDQRLDLVIDGGALKAHHEELAHLSVTKVSVNDTMPTVVCG